MVVHFDVRLAALAGLLPLASCAGFECSSSLKLGPVVKPNQKGFALDDTTFHFCTDKITAMWPHTSDPVTSLRLFKAWEADWPDDVRDARWNGLVDFVHANNAKILLGTQITCNETEDDEDWALVKQLLKRLGPDRVMGVAIGNELELYYKVDTTTYRDPACISKLFAGRYYIEKTKKRVDDLNTLGPGWSDVRITAVFGAYALAGVGNVPFVNTHNSSVNDYLAEAYKTYGRRFAFTFNIYSYFDTGNHLDPSGTTCDAALKLSGCLGDKCLDSFIGEAARKKMTQLTGNPDDTFWIGETGWSSPMAQTLNLSNPDMSRCKDWSSPTSFQTFYTNFLNWDLVMDGIQKGPDHVFYFTMRDSNAFAAKEYFDLVPTCETTQCKLQPAPDTDFVEVTV